MLYVEHVEKRAHLRHCTPIQQATLLEYEFWSWPGKRLAMTVQGVDRLEWQLLPDGLLAGGAPEHEEDLDSWLQAL